MKKGKIIMILAALLPMLLFVFPLWKITLEAPQYPTPLGMYIYINDFADANPHDIKNINLMNHYVGMKYIPDAIPEFKIFPIGIAITTLIGLVIGIWARYRWYLYWFIMMVLVSAAGMIDFYKWEYEYGHDLDPKAIMKFTNPDGSVMGFQPPFFGTKHILNFTAHSYPQLGAYCLAGGIALGLVAWWVARKATRNK